MLALLASTRDNQRGPIYMHRVLAAIHQGNSARHELSLLFGRHDNRGGLFLRYPEALRSLVEKQIQGEYPSVDLDTSLRDDALDFPSGHKVWSCQVRLRPDLYPITRYSQLEEGSTREFSDPLSAILEALAPSKSDPTQPLVEISVVPATAWRRYWTRRAVRRLARSDMQSDSAWARRFALRVTSRFPLVRMAGWLGSLRQPAGHTPIAVDETISPSRTHDREKALHAAAGKVGDFLFAARVRISVAAAPDRARDAKRKLREVAGVLSAAAQPQLATFRISRVRRQRRPGRRKHLSRILSCLPRRRGFLISAEELATLFHPATMTVGASRMHVSRFRKLEPPDTLPNPSKEKDVLRLGRALYRSDRTAFGIRAVDRRRHVYIPGKTGMGKTSLLQNMIVADIHAGRGIGLVDPHGDLAENILRSMPRRRWDDLVLFDPADTDHPIAFNPLDCSGLDAVQRVLRADAMLSVFKKLYAESFQAAARMEDIFRNAFLALVEDSEATLLSLSELLHNTAYRTWLCQRLANPVVREFWLDKFPRWTKRYHNEAVAPVENKVRGLTSNPLVQGMLGQPKNKLSLRQIMDEEKILIANLSKGNCGEDVSKLCGNLLVTLSQQAAMSRANIREAARRDFYLYIDEFQNFATESFATVLSESRKYRAPILTLANQYLDQLDEATRSAVFGNVGTLISFAVGTEDAEALCKGFGDCVTPTDLVHLPKYHAYVGLMIDGKTSDPFLMTTSKPPEPSLGERSVETLLTLSRHKYSGRAGQVRETLAAA